MANAFNYQKILNGSLASTPQDSVVVRSNMADGYASQHQRFSLNFINYEMEYLMSATQYAAFLVWWKTNMALFFTFTDPIDGVDYQGRIVEGKFSASPFSQKQNYYSVTMTVEKLL